MNELPLKPELRSSIAMEIERLADRCIELRESLFKFSWRRLIPLLGFFEAIDYADLFDKGGALEGDILETGMQMASLLDEVKVANIFCEDIEFLESCRNFCDNLHKEVVALNMILGRLKRKVRDRATYPRQQYNADVNSHKQLMIQSGGSYDRMVTAYQSALSRLE